MSTDSVPFSPHGRGRRCALIGIYFATDLSSATGVLASFDGQGLGCRVAIEATARHATGSSACGSGDRIARGCGTTAADVPRMARALAETAAAVVCDLAPARYTREVTAVGVSEPGLWQQSDDSRPLRLSLFDAARLAEVTGLTVIDDFPSRDLAHGGQGGPVDALAQWMLLRDPSECQVLIDLGRTTRMTYLPPYYGGVTTADQVFAMDIGPGMAMLNQLVMRLTEGRNPFDPGGTLAVQGRHIPQLLDRLVAAPELCQSPPSWHPFGIPPDRLVDEAIEAAVESGWSLRDLLCTATHLVAESVARAVRQHVPKTPPLRRILYTGGGRQNGLLLREIARRLPEIETAPVDSLGVLADDLDAISAAVLALLQLDQVPQTHMFVTGIVAPRLLGRITPGGPKAWHELLRQLHENRPTTMSLRSAV